MNFGYFTNLRSGINLYISVNNGTSQFEVVANYSANFWSRHSGRCISTGVETRGCQCLDASADGHW